MSKQLVLAIFENEAAADDAVKTLMSWERSSADIATGAVSVMTKGPDGKVHSKNYGSRAAGKGMAIGAIMGAIATVLTGGLFLVWLAGGGIIGAFIHKGLGLSKEDLKRLSEELDNGRAAVGVMALPEEAKLVSDVLATMHGRPEVYAVSDEALAHAESEAEAQPQDEAAEPPAGAEPAA